MTTESDVPEHLRPSSWWMRQAAEQLIRCAEQAERMQTRGMPVAAPHLLAASTLSRRILRETQ